MNKVILYGNIGKDPESKVINQKTVTKFTLATNKTYTNASGEKITDTQWHNIVLWGKVAEIASKYAKKGNPLIVEGEISYRSYQNKDDQTVYVTEIIGSNIHLVSNKQEETKQEAPKSGKVPIKSLSDINELPGNVADYDELTDNPDDIPL